MVDFNLLDDDAPTPTLSEYSDEEDIVFAAESLLEAKSNFQFISSPDIKEESPNSQKKVILSLGSKHSGKKSARQPPLIAPKVQDTSEIVKKEHLSPIQPTLVAKPVIPDASPLQIEKIKRLLGSVSDDLETVVSKKARLSKIYEEAKQLEIKSMLMDREFYQSSSVVVPPSSAENPVALDDTLVELMQDHISELEDKVKHSLQTRKVMFAAIESLEESRATKDSHFRESFSAALGTPIEQLTPLLNDSLQEESDEQ